MADLTIAPIAANGDYEFPTSAGLEHIAMIAGTFAAGSLELYYEHPARKARGEADPWVPTGIVITPVSAAAEDLIFPFLAPSNRMKWVALAIAGDAFDVSVNPVIV